MLRFLYKISRKVHKIIGLLIILFLIWSSISGIVLNHKELFSPFTVPSFMVPDQYNHSNWNRGSMIRFLFLQNNQETGFVGGKRGIFKTMDSGKSFEPFMNNYPEYLLYKKTNDLLLIDGNDDKDTSWLFAGNNKGLYYCDVKKGKWERIIFSQNSIDMVLKIIRSENKLIIITDSDIFTMTINNIPDFKYENLNINRNDNQKMNLIDYFRHIHSGNVWGLFGRLLFDLLGLIIVFLSISAFYIWYFPIKNRKLIKKPNTAKKNLKYLKPFLKYHKSIGIYTSFFILIVAITAFFMRPPFVAVIANTQISSSFYPAFGIPEPWDKKLHNGIYIEESGKLILETTEGFYEGFLKKGEIFKKINSPLNVFVMGATVFEKSEDGYLLGSFNGLYKVSGDGVITDHITKLKPSLISSIRPGKYMITGYLKTPDGEEFITTHRKGVLYLNGNSAKERFPMPRELSEENSISLWNYMFELHNGRIFKDLIGNIYILIIPLFSLFLFLVVISGIIDWLIIRPGKNRIKKNMDK